jgi:hypothetical protein
MADRWQVMKKTNEGVFRTTTDSEIAMKKLCELAQEDPKCRWIVVKDRVLNRRGMVWRRNTTDEIDWWILQDAPEISVWHKNNRKP